MGITFGGGFGLDTKQLAHKGLQTIYETEQQGHKVVKQTLDSEFKENMLLSFYRWPYHENSTLMPTTNKSSSI